MPDMVYIAPISSVSLVECIAIVLSCRRRQSLLCTWSTSRQCLPCLWRQFQPRARRRGCITTVFAKSVTPAPAVCAHAYRG